MNFDKVSIIIPVYNVVSYLEKCISSIIVQSYSNIEIVIVDDGSTDGSSSICDEYASKDSRIRVIHKNNGGVVAARRDGLKISTGRFVTFVDGDDYLGVNYVSNLYEGIIKSNADIVASGYYNLRKDCIKKISVCNENIIIDNPKEDMNLWKSILLQQDTGINFTRNLCQKMFKRELIINSDSFVPINCTFGEDFLTIMEYMFQAKRIMFIASEEYYYITYREGSATNDRNISRLYNTLFLIQQIRETFIRHCCLSKFIQLFDKVSKIESISAFRKILSQNINKYVYNDYKKLFCKKIIIYGAGKVGYDYYCQLIKYNKIDIAAWIDKKPNNYDYEEYDIQPVDIINELQYDYILISVANENVVRQIKNMLQDKYNISAEKIIWKKPEREMDNIMFN